MQNRRLAAALSVFTLATLAVVVHGYHFEVVGVAVKR